MDSLRANPCQEEWADSQGRLGGLSDHSIDLTLVKERGKEGRLHRRVLGYKVVSGSSARPAVGMRVLQPKCPIEGPSLTQE